MGPIPRRFISHQPARAFVVAGSQFQLGVVLIDAAIQVTQVRQQVAERALRDHRQRLQMPRRLLPHGGRLQRPARCRTPTAIRAAG